MSILMTKKQTNSIYYKLLFQFLTVLFFLFGIYFLAYEPSILKYLDGLFCILVSVYFYKKTNNKKFFNTTTSKLKNPFKK